MTTQTPVPVFPRSSGIITEDAGVYRGVALDRLDVTGPRGGKQTLWRAARKREYQMASWAGTRAEAAK